MDCTIYGHVLNFYFRSYYRIFFYLSMYCTFTVHFQWTFLHAGILQHIFRNSDVLSMYSERIIFNAFLKLSSIVWYDPVDRASVSQAAGPGLNPAWCVLIFSVLPDFSGRLTGSISLKATGILQYMDSKNDAGKFPSIYCLHCHPAVYLLELSSKLKTVHTVPHNIC